LPLVELPLRVLFVTVTAPSREWMAPPPASPAPLVKLSLRVLFVTVRVALAPYTNTAPPRESLPEVKLPDRVLLMSTTGLERVWMAPPEAFAPAVELPVTVQLISVTGLRSFGSPAA